MKYFAQYERHAPTTIMNAGADEKSMLETNLSASCSGLKPECKEKPSLEQVFCPLRLCLNSIINYSHRKMKSDSSNLLLLFPSDVTESKSALFSEKMFENAFFSCAA